MVCIHVPADRGKEHLLSCRKGEKEREGYNKVRISL